MTKAIDVKTVRRILGLPTVAILWVLLAPGMGAGQSFPGVPGGGGFAGGRNLAEYYAEVTARTSELFALWRKAWVEDNVPQLAALYHPEAMLYLPDRDAIFTRDLIAEAFSELLPETGEIQAAMLDFDASGKIAYISGMFTLDFRDANGVRHHITGDHMTVCMRTGRTWVIRSQMFRPDPPRDLNPLDPGN